MTLGESIRILLVEDNPADVRLTREVMKDARILNELETVNDGESALDFLHRRGKYKDAKPVDLVLLDLNLPRLDGREVLADIKKHPQLCRIPVVVLTTSQAEADVLKSYELHANCYITKPVELDQFTKVLKEIQQFWLTIVKLPPESPHE